MAASPYGFWTSPITSDLVVADSIRLEQVALDGDAIYWTETQPQKQGRTFVYRIGADGEPERVTPDDANAFSVRARAHEYGGGAFAVSDGVIYFSNNIDQRLYRQDAGRPPSPITPAPAGAAADAFRYADGVIDRRQGAHGLRPGRSHWGRRGDHDASRPSTSPAQPPPRFSSRGTTSIRRHVSAPTETACPG